jgi:hypothetical protein
MQHFLIKKKYCFKVNLKTLTQISISYFYPFTSKEKGRRQNYKCCKNLAARINIEISRVRQIGFFQCDDAYCKNVKNERAKKAHRPFLQCAHELHA